MAVSLSSPATPKLVPSSLLAPMRRGTLMNFPCGVRLLG